MHRTYTKLLTGTAVGLAAAVLAPIASAGSSPRQTVTIPESLARVQYPGTSSKPTVYVNRTVAIPAWLARIQYPGTSSKPTFYVNRKVTIPAWLARIQYPGTYSEASVLIPRAPSTPVAAPVVAAQSFDWAAFGIGIAAATGMMLMGVSALLAVRRRRTPAHA